MPIILRLSFAGVIGDGETVNWTARQRPPAEATLI
jgi:hypothetical protein